MRRIYGLRVPVVLITIYWLAIFVGTHIPRGSMPKIQSSDKLLHVGAYAWLAAFLCWAIPKKGLKVPVEVWAFPIAIAYGAIDELSQIPVGRTADWQDWFADIVGALLGLVFYRAARSLYVTWRRMPTKPISTP